MEALWNLEDKWKLKTQDATLIFLCTAFAVIGLCAAAMLRRKAQRKHMAVVVDQDHPARAGRDGGGSSTHNNNWMTIRRVLMGSARWSEASKWEDGSSSSTTTAVVGSWRSPEFLAPPRTPLLGLELEVCVESSRRRQSHNSASPVWQRPILMGEKCELPRFSGLILYDERGRLLDHSLTSSRKEHMHTHNHVQEKPGAGLRTTLRDLL